MTCKIVCTTEPDVWGWSASQRHVVAICETHGVRWTGPITQGMKCTEARLLDLEETVAAIERKMTK